MENVKADGGSGRAASEYGDITVDEGSRVSSDLAFDPQRMHLYAMTERKVRLNISKDSSFNLSQTEQVPFDFA